MSKQLSGYEKVGRLFRLLGWLSLISGICFVFLIFTQEEVKPEEMIGLVVLSFTLPILYLPLGKAIKEHKRWGRIVGNIVGVLALFAIPIGTLIGIYILILLNNSWVEQPPDQPTRLGIKKKDAAAVGLSNEIEKSLSDIRTKFTQLPHSFPAIGESVGPGAEVAKQQISIISTNIEQALKALESGLDPNGNPITRELVGEGLTHLVNAAQCSEFLGLMSCILSIEGVTQMEGYLNELKSLAGQLAQLSPADEQRLEPPKRPSAYSSEEDRREKRAEWLSKAEKLQGEGQYEEAIEYWDLVIGGNLDSNGWAHYLKGCTLAELHRPEDAAKCLKEALNIDPNASKYALELGCVLHELGRWPEARSAFKKVMNMDGVVYGDDDKAMEWLKKMDNEGC